VDGKIGFLGGLNVGDEYIGQVPRFGLWRDTHLAVQGPAVADLQRVFAEDWDFVANERLGAGAGVETQKRFFPRNAEARPPAVQELERAFLLDLETSIRLDRAVYARRPFSARLAENACRLFSPIL